MVSAIYQYSTLKFLGKYPCLWCCINQVQMQKSPDERDIIQERTLASTRTKFLQYQAETDCDKSKAKFYQNVIHSPLLAISFSRVSIFLL